MSQTTLVSGSRKVPYMPMTRQAIICPAPVLLDDFESCDIPGGTAFWEQGGFYSPGVCFIGYDAICTQSQAGNGDWPIRKGETAVRCIPSGYDCNESGGNQRYATSDYGSMILSAPAFEIRWRSEDLGHPEEPNSPPEILTLSHKSTSNSASRPSSSSNLEITRATTTVPSISSSQASNPTTDIKVSKRAIAGIVAGSFAALCITIMAFLLLKRRCGKARKGRIGLIDGPHNERRSSENIILAQQEYVELEDKPRNVATELSAETVVAELSPYTALSSPLGPVSPIWRQSHVSVNKFPVEMAADSNGKV